jgi:hypothetical protein
VIPAAACIRLDPPILGSPISPKLFRSGNEAWRNDPLHAHAAVRIRTCEALERYAEGIESTDVHEHMSNDRAILSEKLDNFA